MSTAISVRLPEKIAHDIDEIAQDTERSRSFHIQKAVEIYIKEYADLQIALDRLNDPTDAIISVQEMRTKITVPQKA
jgi:RHH-type rel operon transcriptional repressor/antitoxin RelB